MLHGVIIAYSIFGWVYKGVALGVALAGIVGAVMVFTTREDAFPAADRQPKLTWVALLVGSALAVGIGLPIIMWIGFVVIGLYWFDVYPQVRDIVRGEYNW